MTVRLGSSTQMDLTMPWASWDAVVRFPAMAAAMKQFIRDAVPEDYMLWSDEPIHVGPNIDDYPLSGTAVWVAERITP